MKHIFTKRFALLIMAAMSMGVMASTVDDLVAIDHDYVFIADDVTNNGADGLTENTLYAGDHILSLGGNSAAANKGNSTIQGVSHLNCLRIKSTQNRLAFKVSGACTITFYTQSHASRGLILSNVDNNIDTEAAVAVQSYETSVWEVNIPAAGVYYLTSNGDFFFAGFEVVFPDDPADVYTLGLTAELNENTLGSVETRSSGCAHVTTSALQTTYQTLSDRTVYHGSETAFTSPVVHRNLNLDNVLIKTQDGETDGAENHNAYMAFTLDIEEDYLLSLREISSDLYVDNKSNWSYEYVIEKGGVELYKSPVQTIAAAQSGTDHANSIANLRWNADLQGLTGQVTVKLIWWINSGGTVLALKDFNVTGALSMTDNPHMTFGIGREFEDATHFESGVEKLMGTAPEHVTVALHNGAGLDHMDGNKDLCHGTSATVSTPTAYRNHCYATDALANGVFLDNFYWGFSVDVELGYSMSISRIYGDMYAQKNKIQYKMGVYTSDADDAEPIYMSDIKEGTITTMGSENVPMTVNTNEIAALQNLTGKIYFRFYWNIASTAANAALKDFNISAIMERVSGEGTEGLSFVSFTPAAHPVFTEGEVTATWSNDANNVGPDGSGRGIRMQNIHDYKMKVEVPSDSYISEVVIVWNKNGNYYAGDENPKRIIDLHILNSSEVEVDALEYRGAKVNETTWNCGELRESELTFAQGEGGDIYVNSIRVTYLKKPATTAYVRTHTHMNLNTLCYPYQIDSYTGAIFYTMLYKVVENTEVTEVVLQEHVGALEAGKPYFYVPEGSELVCNYSGDYTAAGNDGNGVYGSYTDMADVANGMYVTYNNQIIKAGDNVKLREYRAYINMDEVSLQSGANLVPGRRQLRIASVPQQTTGVENTSASAIHGGSKILRNGQLFIIRNGVEYNVNGQMTK